MIVIAHGFAGSQQLMQPFAVTFARAGYIAVTFDFLGHGRNPRPLGGSITEIDGATRSLAAQTAEVVAFARTLGDGRVAILGHSMASDIVVRVAQARPGDRRDHRCVDVLPRRDRRHAAQPAGDRRANGRGC